MNCFVCGAVTEQSGHSHFERIVVRDIGLAAIGETDWSL